MEWDALAANDVKQQRTAAGGTIPSLGVRAVYVR